MVDAFSADLSCERAVISHVSDPQCYGGDCDTLLYNLTATSDTCTTNTSQVSSSIRGPSTQYYGRITAGKCIGAPSNTDVLRYTIVTGHQTIDNRQGATDALNSTALICRPVYQLCRSPVRTYLNGTIVQVPATNASCSSIPHLSNWGLGSAVMGSIGAAANSSLVDFSAFTESHKDDNVQFDTFFDAMYATAGSINHTDYTNVAYLETSARQLFSAVAAQIVKSHVLQPANFEIPGMIWAYEPRLIVCQVSLRLLESIFALLIVIAMVTLLLRPSSSTPCDLSTLAGISTILARSPQTCAAFRGLSTSSGNEMQKRINGKTCKCVIKIESERPVFRLVTSSGSTRTGQSANTNENVRWWQPLSMSIGARIGLTLLPLAVIAALEAIYQHSAKQNGLANVGEWSGYHYVWTYIPALFMLAVQACFQLVDFHTRVLQPYHTMRSTSAVADQSVNNNYLSQLTPTSIWKALSHRHWAVVATGFTMFLAPILTVVVSGLYGLERVEAYAEESISLHDTINNSVAWGDFHSFKFPYNGNPISTLITEANLSFPSWTFDGYVLPQLETRKFLLDQFGQASTSNTTTVKVTMPAVYASLNCTWAAPVVSFDEELTNGTSPVSVPVPLGCGNVCADTNSSITNVCDTSNSRALNLTGGILLKNGTNSYGIVYKPSGEYLSIPQDCPQLAFVYGEGFVDETSNAASLFLDAAVCSPVVYQVMVNATFTMPGFSITSVEADQSQREILAAGRNATLDLSTYLPPTDWNVDGFFGGLVPGRDGSAWIDLIGLANFDNFSTHVDKLYSIIYTQWLSFNARVSAEPDTKPLRALVMNPRRMRLTQSAVSTRILEGLLAAMAICTVAAFFLIDTRKLLPNNPCSIGAMVALLAESDLIKTIPEGAEWHDSKERQQKRVFGEYTFSLGWWEGLGGRKRFGVDVGRDNDR